VKGKREGEIGWFRIREKSLDRKRSLRFSKNLGGKLIKDRRLKDKKKPY